MSDHLPDDQPRVEGKRPARLRFFRAYTVALIVIASYLWLGAKRKVLGEWSIRRALPRAHRRNARRIERSILKLQGLYIKVGQLFSILTNFLPDAYRVELEKLQDAVPPRPYEEIKMRLAEELDRDPAEAFSELDPRPVASASIAQVHLATTRTGQPVAVKVQYPDIEKIVATDLDTLEKIFRLVERFLPAYGLEHAYQEIRKMILAELDFESEGRNIEAVAANFEDSQDLLFPKVHWDLTTAKVLVTEYLPGTKVADIAALDQKGIDRRKLAEIIVHSYCKQIFLDGCYHADPHPGNLMVRKTGDGFQVVLVDFGSTGRLSEKMRLGILEFVEGALQRDGSKILHAIKSMGFVARGSDPRVFDRVVRYYLQKFESYDMASLQDIRFDADEGFADLAALDQLGIGLGELTRSFHVPREWVLLERTLLLLMGLCTRLDPAMNPVKVIEPYFTKFVLGENRDWSQFLVDAAKNVGLSSLSLPGEIRRFLDQALAGEIEVRIAGENHRARRLYALGHQAIYAFLAVSGAGFATYFHSAGMRGFMLGAGVAGGFFGLLFFGSLLRHRRW